MCNFGEFAKLRYTLLIKKIAIKLISRFAGSWGKVKIPFCRHFDIVFEKNKIFEKNINFYLKNHDFSDIFSMAGKSKILKIKKKSMIFWNNSSHCIPYQHLPIGLCTDSPARLRRVLAASPFGMGVMQQMLQKVIRPAGAETLHMTIVFFITVYGILSSRESRHVSEIVEWNWRPQQAWYWCCAKP